MMITLDLFPSDATFLAEQIGLQLDRMQNELVHTDDRALHRSIAADIEKLEKIRDRIVRASRAEIAREMYLQG